jgi:plastocyanin
MLKEIHLKLRPRVTFIMLISLLSMMISCKKPNDIPVLNEVIIKDMAFTPATITVTPGTTITWTNNDAIEHTVSSDLGLFDSGPIASGETYSQTFSMTGTFPYHCLIHTIMTGTVIVKR